MKTDKLHGDVIDGMSAYHELDHDLVTADTEVPGYRPGWPALELASWSAGDDHELTGDQADRLRHSPGVPMPTCSGTCCGRCSWKVSFR